MSWNFGSKKKAAILAAVLGGCLMGQVAWAAEFDTAITGGTDAAYAAAGVKNGETYALAEDTVIRINVVKDGTLSPDTGAVLLSGRNNIDIMMGSHNLTMDVSGDNSYLKGIHQGFSGGGNISVEGTGLLTIDVKDGSMRSHGIATGATGQSVTVHAPLKATVGSRRESYGVSLGSGSTVSLLGDTDITVNKNASLSAALYAERTGGTINVNYVDGAIGSADTKVVLNGDIYSRRVRDDYDYNEFNTVNIGLSGSDSVWNGISGYRAEEEEDYDSFDVTIYEEGVVNLALQNGAVWNNEAYGTGNKDVGWNGYKGSRVTTLTGGADAGSAGIIFQKDGKPLTIGKLAGTVTLLYAHEGDGSAVENYTAGDTTVKAAEDGAHLVMITDSTGIATDDKEKVAGALNAMAQKFYYPAKDGKLTGQAKIAEGLTAVSATKGVGDMDFGGEKGQASVKPETVKLGEEEAPVPPVETSGPITGPETLNADREITWSDSMSSQNKKISAFYTEAASSKAQPMVVDLNGHNLTIHAESHDPVATALYVGNNAYLDVLNGDPDKKFSITATNTDTRGANGIYVEGNAHFKITGAVDIEKVETKGDSATGIAFQGQDSEGLMTGPVYIHNVEGLKGRGAGINNSGILMTGERSKLEIAGPVYITDIKGAALKNRGGGTVLSVGGGEIRAAEDTDKSKNYAAARVEQGTMNINMVDGHAGSTTTKITGDMYITGTHGQRVAEYSNGQLVDWAKPGHLNVALTDKDSFWKGAATYDKYRSDYGSDGGYTAHDVGEFRLDLKNGALWTNELQSHGTTTTIDKGEDYAGSRLKTLNGGTKEAPGYIYQKEALPIKVENYSGSTVVCYDHDAANPSDVKGGEFHIAHAEEDSNITLRTDNQGLDTTSQTEEAKGKVNSALNALAQKLYYSDYIKGDKTLTGTVEIAEGLTATSAFFTGPITFIADVDTELNGQGSYVPKEEAVEGGPISAPEVLQTARISKGTAPNANDGYVVSGLYSEAESPADNPMVVDLNGHDLTVAAESTSTMADGVFVGKDRNIHIKNGGENDFIITASNTGGNANGIRFGGNNSSIVVDGPVTIDGVKAGKRSANGVGMNFGPASATFNGPLTITNVEAAGDSTGVQTYGIYANATGAKVVVTGPLNISNVKGSAVGAARQGAEVFTAGGRITAVADPDKRYFAVRAANGTINMNVEGAANHIAPSSLVITGDIEVGGQGVANINLPDAKSSWTGIVSNRNKMNLTLQNGATWTTKRHSFVVDDMNELKVTSLKGGEDKDTAGIIRPEDSRTVVIGDYSGNAVIYYPHTAEATSTMIGADVKIAKAAPGSHVILRTGNEGLDTESENPQSNQAVTAALKALANKFWYTGFVNEAEKDNLTGTVEIAEGLTSRSALRSGRLGFIAGTGQGDYSSRMEIKNKFSSTIYGIEEKDQEYVDSGVRQADGTYKFTDDAVISTKDANATADKISYYRAVAGIVGNGNDVTVTSGDKTLRLQQVAGDRSYQALGVYANKKVDITAGLLDINETSSGSDAIGILAHEGGEVAIHGDVRIRAYHTGDGNSKGMNLYNKGAKIIIDGDMDMGGKEGSGEGIYGVRSKEKGGYGSVKSYQAVGVNIYDRNGAELVVKGDAYIGVKGTGVDMRGSANNKVTLAGGKIITPMEGGVYKAASIAAGHFTMGMNEARNAVNGKAVEIAGNIYRGDDADIVIGLGTADSSWSGVVYDHNSRGEGTGVIKLYLANGGTWNFDNVSYADNINYVPVARLVGGSDMEHAGVLFPKQQEDLRITRFEGNLAIVYPHDAMAPQFVNGGDVHILGAEADSHVRMITDSDGLNTASGEAAEKEKVKNTLNALAGKLYYENYHAGERNLTGTVEIAEGLTAASAKLTGGDITFKDEDGQGQYLGESTPVEPEPELPDWHNVPITGNTAEDADPSQKTFEKAGILKDGAYTFTEDATLTAKDAGSVVAPQENVIINAAGHTLTMNQEGREGDVSLISNDAGKKIEITADKVVVDDRTNGNGRTDAIHMFSGNESAKSELVVNGDLEVTAINGGNKAMGIYAGGNAVVTVNGNLKMNNGEEWAVDGKQGSFGYYDAVGIYATSNMGPNSMGAKVVVNGDVDMKVLGNGMFTNAGGSTIDTKGDVAVEVKKDNRKGYAALRAEDGVVNVNVVKDGSGKVTGADSHKVNLKGNVAVTTGAVNSIDTKGTLSAVNLGLSTADSFLHGVVYNAFKDEGKVEKGVTFTGESNLVLENGATWTNEKYGITGESWGGEAFAGSKVTSFIGGSDESKAGVIFQKDSNGITINNYSGFTKVFYEHEAAGSAAAPVTMMRAAAAAPAAAPVTFKGGDITIKKAAAGSGIILVTDNAGLDMGNKASVDSTLNALANKLYYSAYTEGERNLAGKVEIAEGLTASSVSVRLEDITFKDENGQGQYIAPVAPEPEPEKDFHNVPITGNTAEDAEPSQKPFVKEGILKDGVYTFDKDTTLTAKDADSVVAPQENVKINAAGHTLTMNQEGHEGGVNLISDGTGKKVEITADKVVLDDRAGGRTDAIHMFSKDENAKSELVVNGDLDVTAINSKDNANGIYAGGNAAVTVNGNVKMNNGAEWAVDSHESGYGYYGASGIYSTSNMGPDGMGAKVVVNGDVDLKVNGNGMYTNAGGSTIDTKGDVAVEVKKDNTRGYAALRAEDGVVNVNVVKDGSGKVAGADSHKVNIKGNVAVTTGAVNSVDTRGTLSAVNLGLSTPDSSLHGVVYNAFKDEGKVEKGVTFTGESNLVLENGATWTNEKYGITGESWGGENFAGSKVTSFTGGASEDKAGFILQKEETPLKLRSYKGFTKVAYEHDADSPTTIKGGDVEIGKAAAGSGITLMTDNAGLNTASKADADKKLVTDTLTALAGKLKYEAYKTGEKNLAGKVEIAEGLTASSASLDTRDIVFTDEGVGTLAKGEEPGGGETPGGGEIEYGDKETVMMRGAKTALASSAMVWRNTNSDLQQRLGDVRLGREDVGIWAKYKGGKLSMDAQKTDLDAKYNSFSVGFDKEIGDNWLVGGAISHLTGDGTYREGTGDLKQTDFTAYGTRVTEDGQYLDLVAKAGQLKNDFHVVNEMGHKLDGDYKANGMSFSVEYGKRFVQDSGFYIDPSVQFTVGRIGGKDFDAASDFKDGKGGFKSMHIQQDAFTSSVGRLGLTVGQQADNYNAFAKMVLAHEFSGTFDTAFSAEGEAQGSKTHLDLKDTWFELEVGGSAKISETSYLYGSFARSMGGDVTNKWRVDAGVRFSF